jgi:hypothetical protein
MIRRVLTIRYMMVVFECENNPTPKALIWMLFEERNEATSLCGSEIAGSKSNWRLRLAMVRLCWLVEMGRGILVLDQTGKQMEQAINVVADAFGQVATIARSARVRYISGAFGCFSPGGRNENRVRFFLKVRATGGPDGIIS